MESNQQIPSRKLPYFGAAIILCALIALVVLPIVMTRRTDELRYQIESRAEPTRNHLNQVNYELSVQISSLNRAGATGDDQYLADSRIAPRRGRDTRPCCSGWSDSRPERHIRDIVLAGYHTSGVLNGFGADARLRAASFITTFVPSAHGEAVESW